MHHSDRKCLYNVKTCLHFLLLQLIASLTYKDSVECLSLILGFFNIFTMKGRKLWELMLLIAADNLLNCELADRCEFKEWDFG